ncbi:hypothetical protein TPA0910_09400 [Streptomyces hygroscopicus subsp. sporocinereus]|uniref:Secreted protein n=1 Tax=Streptomyces hygroscopicus TaxID=1912 RepID=A0ABQ3TT54_STRHY|nr:hypothetical protein TPA0910_09400 [Streptomyces hygroscopicus]
MVWRVPEGCEAAGSSLARSFCVSFAPSAVGLLAVGFFSTAESVSFEQPVTPTTAATSAAPAVQPMVLFL